jgi:O-antigen/teichoic acid export membrane protein
MSGVLRASTLYLVGNILSRAVGFLAIPFYSHYLSAQQYGTIELIELSTQAIGITFGLQSIGSVLSRLFHDQDTAQGEREIASTGTLSAILLNTVICGLCLMVAAPLSQQLLHSDNGTSLLQLAFVAMWFSNLGEVVLTYERIRARAKFFFWYSTVTLILTLAGNIYFIGFAGEGVYGFVYSKLIVTGIGTIYLAIRMAREVGLRWRQSFIPQFLRFGTPLVIASLSAFAIHFSDRFFLSDAVSLADVGRYALAYRFAFLVSVLVGDSFGKSWNVTFYRFSGLENWRAQFASVAHYLMFALFFVALAVSLSALLLIRYMVPESYYPPPFILPALVFSYVLREVGDFFRNLLLINKKSGIVGNVGMISAALNFVLNYVLIFRYGLYGATAATLGTWAVYMVIFWWLAWREHRVPVGIGAFVRMLIFSCLLLVVGRELDRGLGLLGFVAVAGWMLLYLAVAPYVGLNRRERADLFAFLRDKAGEVLRRFRPQQAETTAQTLDAAPPALLMLAYYFPPENAVGALRPARFAKYLARLGLQVQVIANHHNDSSDRDGLRRVPSARAASRLVRRLSWLLTRLTRLVMPFDDRLFWVPYAVAAALPLLAAKPGTLLFSTHPPLATHLAALWLKLRCGHRWVADFRDPLLGNATRHGLRGRLIDTPVEALIFAYADIIIANTATARDAWLRRHPQHADKIRLIWNGFDPEDGFAATPPPNNARKLIAHVGTLYGGRSPDPLIAALARLIAANRLRPQGVQLRLLGPMQKTLLRSEDADWRHLEEAGSLQVDNRMASQDEARAQLHQADILLLLDIVASGEHSTQLPAKMFDYLRAGRPILAFTPPTSAVRDVLARAGVPHLCLSADQPPEETDAALADFISRPHGVIVPAATFLEEFDGSRQAAALAQILAELAAPGSDPR